MLSARRKSDRGLCVLLTPGASADAAQAFSSLSELARVHLLLDHPLIPRVTRLGDADEPFVELDCPASVDGFEVVGLITDGGHKIPYAAADAFIVSLREAMQAAHRVIDPRTGRSLCLGRLSAGNVLFAPGGDFYLFGFGRNIVVEREDTTVDGRVQFYQAPELTVGGAPSEVGDYVALLQFMRSVLPHVEMSGPVGQLLRGELTPAAQAVAGWLLWIEQRIMGAFPHERASIAEAIEAADQIRALQGTALDRAGFREFIHHLLHETEGSPRPADERFSRALIVGPGAVWIEPYPDDRRRLGAAQRKIVEALVAHHERGANEPLSLWQLFEAGWPGEHPAHEAGANRVYVTLNRLRELGLRELIERFDDGYRLHPGTVITRAQP